MTPHPKSIRGRLEAGNHSWLSTCVREGDVFLLVDAALEIERLTLKLAETRRNLRQANRVLEAKASWRPRTIAEIMTAQVNEWKRMSGMTPEDSARFNEHCDKVMWGILQGTQERLKQAAESLQDPRPALETPPQAEKAPQRIEISASEAAGLISLALGEAKRDMSAEIDQKHVTTP